MRMPLLPITSMSVMPTSVPMPLLLMLIIIIIVVVDIMIIGTSVISIMMMIMGIVAHMLLSHSPGGRQPPAQPHRVEVRFYGLEVE